MKTSTPRVDSRILGTRRLRVLLSSSLVAAAFVGCSATPDGVAEQTGTQNQDLYGLGSIATPWPGGQVPVCFQNVNDHPELQALMPGILANSWSSAANITFTGFGSCSGPGNKVSISFVAGSNGRADSLGYGNRAVTLVSDDTSPGRTHFTYEVIHELGHALGFAHEMKRPDNWPGGVERQCPQTPGNDISQYLPLPGGLNLTPNYDPNSIMNYCDPLGANTTQLSVGDILAASSANAYGPRFGCVFPSKATQCTWSTQLHGESTFTVPRQCATTTGWTMKSLSAGGVNLPNACANGAQSGTCPNAQNPNAFVLGWQAEGGVQSGPPIGSAQTVQMCDAFNNCTAPFQLTITDCNTQADQLYLSPGNDPLQVSQEGTGTANVLMYGPWVQTDHGLNAIGTIMNNPIPGATIWMSRGTSINGAGALELTVQVPLWTPPGSYQVTVQVTDVASNVTRAAALAVQVSSCTTSPSSKTCNGIFANMCGSHGIGCGQTWDCGSCASGNSCSSGYCCPTGTTYSTTEGFCQPDTCPSGTSWCSDASACLTDAACAKAGRSHCRGTRCF